ncbi:MAG TPA: TIGR03364 family FAD-dependent oxidoreductase [Isosphaeraceae bacterium]|nr:TIGR03364 family FAD-dependent oxidoreductase [Isosphaeraceae bacterium]
MTTQMYDDAVVGAGVVGLATAYALAKRGRRVVVFERCARAEGASVRNFGMLWPIGQPGGARFSLACHSLALWREVLEEANLWHSHGGSLHLAYREDEAAILREYVDLAHHEAQPVAWLKPRETLAKAPRVRSEGLIGGMWSPSETCIDPREVIGSLPAWLTERFGVQFVFGCQVFARENAKIRTSHDTWQAESLYVCPGADLQTLYPGLFESMGLIRCKLQMMRSEPIGEAERIGPMLAGGLTLRHYPAFERCPSLPALRRRIAEETPEYDHYGIHVLASQNGRGEVVIGDSHEYGDAIEPFDKAEIDALVLDYLSSFLDVPGLRIAQRWHGIYVKHPVEPYVVARPEPSVTVVAGLGGAGMTLSFGLGEQVVLENLGG